VSSRRYRACPVGAGGKIIGEYEFVSVVSGIGLEFFRKIKKALSGPIAFAIHLRYAGLVLLSSK
jgi:hypothetical protein